MIIFSHGFGVRQDDRGLFTDIAKILNDEYVMFDYNQWNESKQQLTVADIDAQVRKLNGILKDNQSRNIDLICHSQGCIVASAADTGMIDRVIFLAPPDDTDVDRFKAVFSKRPGTTISETADSVLGRSDGSKTIVPAEYWKSLRAVSNIPEKYQQLAKRTKLTIIQATQDEVLGKTNFREVLGADIIQVEADHNFTGEARSGLLKILEEVV